MVNIGPILCQHDVFLKNIFTFTKSISECWTCLGKNLQK